MDDRRPTGRWAPWVAILVLAIVVAAAVFAYLSPESFQNNATENGRSPVEVQQGIACKPLEKIRVALANLESSDFQEKGSEFHTAVKAAEREAIKALDTTGIGFGKPEWMALRIAADVEDEDESRAIEQIQERLASAQDFCDENKS